MGEKVRGLTIEINADAKKFKSQLKTMSKDISASQQELNALKKSLELDFDPTKFKRAQEVAQSVIDQTSDKVDTLRQRLQHLENTGNVDTYHYREIQAELAKAELAAQKAKKEIEALDKIKLDALTGKIDKIAAGLDKAASAAKPFSAAAAGAIAAAGALTVSAAATGAEIDDLSLRFGVSAEKIQEWQYIAVQCGVDVDVFNKALIRTRAAMLDLSTGKTNEAAKAIQALGLDMAQFGSNEEMFDGVIMALAGVEDKTLQAAYANEIFGDKIANQMLPFINSGTDAIQQFKDEFAAMSSLSNEQVAALAVLDDTIFRLKESIRYAGLQLGAAFAPLLKSIAEYIEQRVVPAIQRLADWFNSLSTAQQGAALKALLVVAAIAPMLGMLGKLASGISSIMALLPKLGSMLSTLAANPIVAIIAVIAIILMLIYTTSEEFRESINKLIGVLGGALAPVLDIIIGAINQVLGLLSPILEIIGSILATVINLVITALQPLFDALTMIFNMIMPLIEIALIPLKIVLDLLKVPLQVIGQLLGWLAPLFAVFGNIVKGVFMAVIGIVNLVLGFIEDAVNGVIGIINGLIDGVNAALGWLGVNIGRISEVKLRIDTSDIKDMDDVQGIIDTTPPSTPESGDFIYDKTGNITGGGDTVNNDYSTNNTTQNVTVVIENYAAEIDVDDMVKQINAKLAEAM